MKFTLIKFMVSLYLTSFLAAPVSLSAQEQYVEIQSIPATIEEFEGIRDSLASTPEGGAATMLLAMLVFAENETLGLQCMTVALDNSNIEKGGVYKGHQPAKHLEYHLNRFRQKKYWPKATIQGTVPENGYAYETPIRFAISRNKYSGSEESGKVKVFVATYGVSPRPMTMVRNNRGIWKAKELSSFFVDVQAPPSGEDDEL